MHRYEKVIYPERHFPYSYESLGTDVNAAAARRIQTGTHSDKSEICCYILIRALSLHSTIHSQLSLHSTWRFRV